MGRLRGRLRPGRTALAQNFDQVGIGGRRVLLAMRAALML
ncbi:hypothetical protein Rumeso_04086 [Rubellimicrobium mesophilum DSM 19309]|uniref:Uncharacterized protein n=1 Tax=Rubellimicrobium mesophilum DSM 19309 TaxID=442562 RepID=A0A017HJ71_9RHOB|nr:hypothetical protein Rumeso_04086 [Rubellimicrobium mesophilum DSM 19309]